VLEAIRLFLEDCFQARTLDGEDSFRILVAQGKGASNSLLPQADSCAVDLFRPNLPEVILIAIPFN
jgi:hypothetical protein